jgi:hypothetical protein
MEYAFERHLRAAARLESTADVQEAAVVFWLSIDQVYRALRAGSCATLTRAMARAHRERAAELQRR